MSRIKITITISVSLLALLLFMNHAKALLNPAAVYCKSLGYNYVIEQTELGDVGICVLPNGERANALDFLRCEIGENYSFCKIHGYGISTENDTCFCVLPNGTKIEALKLMNVSLTEGRCGDGICALPENFKTCPSDCPSGIFDTVCDGMKDGICDPDCMIQNITDKDPDCITNKTQTKTQICNNNSICEPLRGENVNNCPSDCHCGNGICEQEYEEESYCQIDCDNQVNQPSKMKFITYGIIISLIILLIVYIIKSSKGETE